MSGIDRKRLPKKPDKSLGKKGRVILRQASNDMERRDELGDKEAVHQMRVAMKRMRALLRLLRPRLTDREYTEFNGLCRQLANDLSSNRDADVALDTLEILASDDPKAPSYIRLRGALQADDELDSCPFNGEPDWRMLSMALQGIEAAFEELPIKRLSRKELKNGLGRSYRRGSKLWRRSRKSADTELLHEWRKAVKNTYYQSLLLWKGDRTAGRLKLLGNLLGDLHDLDLLEQRLLARRGLYWLEDLQWLRDRLQRKRRILLDQARICGKRIYVN